MTHTISIKLSLGSALKEMGAVVVSKGMLVFYFWSLVALSVIHGVIQGNINTFFGFLAGFAILVAMFICCIIIIPFLQFLNDWILRGNERTDAFCKAFEIGEKYERHTPSKPLNKEALVIFIALFGVIPFLSSFVVTSDHPLNKNGYAVVGSFVLPIDSTFALSSPFEEIVRINPNQTIWGREVTATTKDGMIIATRIWVDLELEADRDAILAYVNMSSIQEKLTSRLQAAFAQVAGSHTLESLPSDPLILSHLVHQKSLNLLDGIPLTWSGEFTVASPTIIHQQ